VKRILITFLIAVATNGCTSVTRLPDGSTEVRTFGASTVTVSAEGKIETESPGISEGFTKVLVELPRAVLRLLAGMAAGAAGQ